MEPECGDQQPLSLYRLFTKESLVKIERRIADEKAAKEAEAEAEAAAEAERKENQEPAPPPPKKKPHNADDDDDEDGKPRPNSALEAGKVLPAKLGEFPKELFGKPIEDIDEFYHNNYTFMVVARDRNIFRFSASKALFFLSPFNPVRRSAIYVLTHPLFSLIIMFVIIVNCVFMAINKDIPKSEEIFTAIYTCEGLIKILARGFILTQFTYLRDAWNWLDFLVVALAYITIFFPLGNLAALRTFRVLRALKTVAVVPGLKTIVGALLEAVRRLRDVMILSVFVLAIFALIGLQIYQGSLKKKCVLEPPPDMENFTKEEKMELWFKNSSNWYLENGRTKLCGGGLCPENYQCEIVGPNPDYGYTNFDNFGWAMLCAFRLMTQDFWEDLYQKIIRAEGKVHMLFFLLVILMGSFYLLNLILAIVAMSYDEQQKQDQEDAEDEEAEEAAAEEARLRALEQDEMAAYADVKKSPSDFSCGSVEIYVNPGKGQNDDKERISIKSECGFDTKRRFSIVNSKGKKVGASLSLPGSPFLLRKGSRTSQLSWRPRPARGGDRQPLVLPYLDNLNLPYADDSNAVTPTSDELCNVHNTHMSFLAPRRRLSSTSHGSRVVNERFMIPSRRSSYASHQSRHSFTSHGDYSFKKERNREPTHFHWNTASIKNKSTHPLLPEESSSSGSDCDTAKGKLFPDNPFICRTPSTTMVDMKDVLVLKDLIDHASGKRRSFLHDEGGLTKKEMIMAKIDWLINGWECCDCWKRFSYYIELFIMDAFVDLFIILCILVNTLFMAMDRHNMSDELTHTLTMGNYFFTAIFAAEAVFKIMALGMFEYLKDRWNCFDIVIVLLSLVELGLSGVKGLSILRSFRLLRVFKLAKSWPTLNLLIGIIGRTLGALGNLTFVLAIIVFIFAVMGMQLFGENYTTYKSLFPDGEVPNWNFTDFLHSFMIVFRVLCGEWIESMWDCMVVAGYICVPFFLLTMIIGNLVVLNLFLALLLSSFGAESLQQSQDDSEPNKLQEAVDRINRFVIFVKSHVLYFVKVKVRGKAILDDFDPSLTKTDLTKDMSDGHVPMRNGRVCEQEGSDDDDDDSQIDKRVPLLQESTDPMSTEPSDNEDGGKSYRTPNRQMSMSSVSTAKLSKSASRDSKMSRSPSTETKGSKTGSNFTDRDSILDSQDDIASIDKPLDALEGPEINEVTVQFVKYPDECCPAACTSKSTCCESLSKTKCGQIFWKYRCFMFKMVEHNYFETFIIVMIVASSLALAVEDRHITLPERWWLELSLKIIDKIFTVVFVLEMCIKWSAFGFKKYFTDAWCWLDFVIVTISLVSLGAEGAGMSNIGAFKALRTLRALRPLRAVSRWEGMKVVVNALIQAIPSIFHVMTVCLVFWLIFSIMGVQLFRGRFFKCIDPEGNVVNATIIQNRSVCESEEYASQGYEWKNSKINFDNALNGYLALFQVATFKGWTEIISDAVRSKEIDQQPERGARDGMYLYFVLFIVFGSFFTLNLFIGVIIDNFNMQKKKGGSLEMFMTDDQKRYYNAMKKLGSKQPQKPIPKPKLKFQMYFFLLTTNQKFDIGIMSVILMNMFTMAMEHYGQSELFDTVLGYINQVFIAIFTLECAMKIIGLRWYYFKQAWNIFDFVVVVLSVMGLAMDDLIKQYFVSPTLLRVVRVFRVGRVLRLVKSAKGIRTLLFSLAVSLPALFNIGLLLFLVMFIYSIFGMSFFMYCKHVFGLDDLFNFETFGQSMIVLFQISTSAGWHTVLAGITNEEDCSNTATDDTPNGDCGSYGIGVLFMITYLIMSFLVVVNMYIAVILENFSQATEDVQQGLTQDDFDMYYEIWEKYDEEATEYIPLAKVSDFVAELEEPLCLPKPNYYQLVSMKIPICEDEKVHCVDILDALTRNYLGTTNEGDMGDIKPERHGYVPISSTLKRQREIICAKIIQRAWTKFVRMKKLERGEIEIAPDGTVIKLDHPPVKSDVIVHIEEEEEEAEEEGNSVGEKAETSGGSSGDKESDSKGSSRKRRSSSSSSSSDGSSGSNDKDMTDKDESSGGDTRTVELYPESGVVA